VVLPKPVVIELRIPLSYSVVAGCLCDRSSVLGEREFRGARFLSGDPLGEPHVRARVRARARMRVLMTGTGNLACMEVFGNQTAPHNVPG
jgi:hypothetical protein